VKKLPDIVSQPFAASLEARRRALARVPRGALEETAAWHGVLEQRARVEHLLHVLGVWLPVRSEQQHTAGLQSTRNAFGEGRLKKPALVVTLLVPRVREENLHLIERLRRNLSLEHLDGIVAGHAHVSQPRRVEGEEQPADARRVHLDAEEITLRLSRGERREVLSVSESDLDDAGRMAPEQRVEIEGPRIEFDSVARP